nr:PD-(D/E)XK nuclease-like domain-containing protein [Bacillus sp. SA1-12]
MDNINHQNKFFSDLKTTQDLHKRFWSEKYDGWVSFVEATTYIVAVTKESTPNKAVLHFDESRFDFEYEFLEMKMKRILKVKSGEFEPIRCEKCDYCRSTKKSPTRWK